jgi:hypothetical protein
MSTRRLHRQEAVRLSALQSGPADIHQFTNARRIINGLDAAIEIAGNALKFQDALALGGWR